MIFSFVYCRRYIEEANGLVETGGLLYWSALHQIFIGIYTAELSQFGLFMLREAKLQAVIILLTGAVTAVTQFVVFRLYGPLLWHLPADLVSSTKKNTVDQDPQRYSIFTEQPIWAPAPGTIRHHLLQRYGIPVSQQGLQCDLDRIIPVSGPPQVTAADGHLE
jgi:hypothetical protein